MLIQRATAPGHTQEGILSRKKPSSGSTALVQVVVSLAIIAASAATAGTGHNGVPSPRPPTVCTQLRVFDGSS